jgi:hypothetical protein
MIHNRGKVVHTYSVERGWSGLNEQAKSDLGKIILKVI